MRSVLQLSSTIANATTESIRRGTVSSLSLLSWHSHSISRHTIRPVKRHFHSSSLMMTKTVPIKYIRPDGEEQVVDGEIGRNLMETAHENNIDLEGACGGELACATCHLVFEKAIYDTLPEKSDEEDDLLDLALELTDTSRLGCQICVREDFAGMKVRIPDCGLAGASRKTG